LTPGEFHLLRLMPLAWLVPGKAAVIRQVPTEHGPVTVETRLATDGKTLEVVYEPMFRAPPSNVWLHAPPLRDLGVVKVNDKKVWSGGDRLVAIGAASGVKSTPGRNP